MLSASTRAFFSLVIWSPKFKLSSLRAFLSCVIASLRSFTSLSIAFWLALILSALVLILSALVLIASVFLSVAAFASRAVAFATTASAFALSAAFVAATTSLLIAWPSLKLSTSSQSPYIVSTSTLGPISAANALLATKPTPPNTKLSATAFANIFFIDKPFFSSKF